MYIKRLQVNNIRNLKPVDVRFSESVNLIYGLNGSGKTSFLESLSVLSSGKSFRSHLSTPIIARDLKSATVFGEVDIKGATHRVGVEKTIGKGSFIRVDQKTVTNNSVLARMVPMLAIDNQSFELVTGGSKFRRKLLDWLVFHVKHGFHSDWLTFRESLKQRNAQLKTKGISKRELAAWLPQLVSSGEAITEQRIECADFLINRINALFEIEKDFNLTTEFDRGWSIEKSLEEVLNDNLEIDLRYQNTRKGPHRADILFTTDKKKVSEVLSRGQLKSVVCRFYLALCQCFKESFGVAPILLIDDLPSELDQERAQILINQFLSLGSQLFITGVELNYFDSFLKQNKHAKVFHVKHGTISEETFGSESFTV